jgi:DNA-binding XRE family transcriptional regulator
MYNVRLDNTLAHDITNIIVSRCSDRGLIPTHCKGIKMMTTDDQAFPAQLKEVRKQLTLSQEDLARELGVSFATVNRWENGRSRPSKLAWIQFDAFCAKMTETGRLNLSEGNGWRR